MNPRRLDVTATMPPAIGARFVIRACGRVVCAAALLLSCALLIAADELIETPLDDIDRDHWAYQPLHRPAPPRLGPDVDRAETPLDAFWLERLGARNLSPVNVADRRTLLRRASFNLTGLPPVLDDVMEFEEDTRPDAWTRAIDRMLASPAYGERTARSWLDLARYAESDGFESDAVRPEAWRYRDWVIAASNDDMPYSQFVSWQIAGDLLAPHDPAAHVATGFLLCGPDMPDLNLKEERRHNFLNTMASTVGEVCLGLQFGCAQCHDHKADPISIHDFYRLRAYFSELQLFEDLPLPAGSDGAPGKSARVAHAAAQAAPSFVQIRGDFRRKGPAVRPAAPRIACPPSEDPAQIADRRALAEWLGRGDNALAARVIVNRLWRRHLGAGLCATPSDFGQMGALPSHPELLDWLAVELPHRGWSLKSLQRLILTSQVAQLDSRPQPETREAWSTAIQRDAGNEWLARASRRRLEAEELRDALLFVAGQLNDAAGGEGVYPELPPEVAASVPKGRWPESSLAESRRRSIYLFAGRNLRYPLFEVFDQPDTNLSCAARIETTIAPQALHLLNSDLAWSCAAGVTKQLGTVEDPVARAFELVLARSPTPRERRLAVESGLDSPDRRLDLCLALLNLNEFITVD